MRFTAHGSATGLDNDYSTSIALICFSPDSDDSMTSLPVVRFLSNWPAPRLHHDKAQTRCVAAVESPLKPQENARHSRRDRWVNQNNRKYWLLKRDSGIQQTVRL